MPDRDDNSQYPQENSGDAFLGDTTMEDNNPQTSPAREYASAVDLTGFEFDPNNIQDWLFHNPGKIYDAYVQRIYNAVEPIVLNSVSGIVRTGPGFLGGWSVAESTGGAGASVVFHDGIDAASPIIAIVNLASGASHNHYAQPGGIRYRRGLYVEIRSGAVIGTVQLATRLAE